MAFFWGASGYTATLVLVGALGPGAELFKGYRDKADSGKILHHLIEAHRYKIRHPAEASTEPTEEREALERWRE